MVITGSGLKSGNYQPTRLNVERLLEPANGEGKYTTLPYKKENNCEGATGPPAPNVGGGETCKT